MATAYDPTAVPDALIRNVGSLPPGRVAEVEDFVDFIGRRELSAASNRALRTAVRQASEPSLGRVWSNPEDDVYDGL